MHTRNSQPQLVPLCFVTLSALSVQERPVESKVRCPEQHRLQPEQGPCCGVPGTACGRRAPTLATRSAFSTMPAGSPPRSVRKRRSSLIGPAGVVHLLRCPVRAAWQVPLQHPRWHACGAPSSPACVCRGASAWPHTLWPDAHAATKLVNDHNAAREAHLVCPMWPRAVAAGALLCGEPSPLQLPSGAAGGAALAAAAPAPPLWRAGPLRRRRAPSC